MKDQHYKLIIEKVEMLVSKIDGDDVNNIVRLIDDLTFEKTTNKYSDLIEDLHNIVNAMWCEYGSDYGETQNWDDTAIQILDVFNMGYKKNDEDLTKLVNIIKGGIK